ncbi:MAG TPA: hypothetical protein PLX23_01970 [Candidatus Hydrogenedens sp.]|nr:hypothetical protein [Candidatus Hydrogenedens sp.]
MVAIPEECSSLNVELVTADDEEISTAVIAFIFDSGKIQIGCNTAFNAGTYNVPNIYEQGYSEVLEKCEQPITVNEQFLNIGIKYRVAIYPQGIFVVVFWGGVQKIPSGTLFTVPYKVLSGAEPGEVLPIVLTTKEQPVFVERTFQDEHKEWHSFYCSLSDTKALPEEVNVVSGNIKVVDLNDGIEEGIQEGMVGEGDGEQVQEGAIGEGDGEQVQEGDNTEGEEIPCGSQNDYPTFQHLFYINIGIILLLVVLFCRL